MKITDQQLKRWITEGILKCLTENRIKSRQKIIINGLMENPRLITEMAIERKVYAHKCFFISHLIEHVLLVTYCKLYDRENQNLQHWKREIYAFCEPFTTVLLKNVSKANQITVKKKVLIKTWIEELEIISNRYLNNKWSIISNEEKITSGLTEDMVKVYTNIIYNLINCIAGSDDDVLKNYINSL